MKYIYYIGANNQKTIDLSAGGNYIGQGSEQLDAGEEYGRMLQHLKIAYGRIKGPVLGSELLIRQLGASDVWFGVYDAPNYGLDPRIFTGMENDGGDLDSEEARLDAAEICHIISHRGDLSKGNIATGGQGKLVGQSSRAQWRRIFESEFGRITRKDYSGNTDQVKIAFSDSTEVAIKKLLYPDRYIMIRYASGALEKTILYNADMMKKLITIFFKQGENQMKNEIKKQVEKTINILNQKVFKQELVTDDDISGLIDVVISKIIPGLESRLKAILTEYVKKLLRKNPNLKIDFIVNGIPFTENSSVSNSNVVNMSDLHIRRTNWIKLLNGVQPQGYILLMNNPAPIPQKNQKTNEHIHMLVESCIYDIFKHHLSNVLKNVGPSKPNTYLKDRVYDQYTKYREHYSNFRMFFYYAMGLGHKEKGRSLHQVETNKDFEIADDKHAYTFLQSVDESTGLYIGSTEFVNEVEKYESYGEIPDYLG